MKAGLRRVASGFAAATLLCLAAGALRGSEQDRVRLEISVTAEATGEPIKNASVYVKFKQSRTWRRDKDRTFVLKTNPEGKAVVPELPEGRVLVQIIAPGWKTYGEFHEIAGPKQTIDIKLQRPKKQY